MTLAHERETEHPPAHLLPQLAKALGVSADQLLGMQKSKTNGRTKGTRLWRRFAQVQTLPPEQRKHLS